MPETNYTADPKGLFAFLDPCDRCADEAISLTDSVIDHWRLNNTLDWTGIFGHNFSTTGTPTNDASGKFQQAVLLQSAGFDALQQSANAFNAAVHASFSIQLWAKSSADSVESSIIAIADGNGAGFALGKNNNDQLKFSYGNDGTGYPDSVTSGGSLNMDGTTYNHIVAVRDASAGLIKIAFNGNPFETSSTSTLALGTGGNLKIATNNGVFAQYWDGSIDSVTFWDRALTQAEATQLWNSGAGLDWPYA